MIKQKKVLTHVAFLTLLIFVMHIIIPLDALALRNNISSAEIRKFFHTFPSMPQGIQNDPGPKIPQFYVHHLPDPINVLNGNLLLAYQDLFISARGFPLEVSRSYNSRSTTRGIFGYGWWSSLDSRLEQVSNGSIQISEWDGSSKTYTPASSAQKELKERIYRPTFPSIHYVQQNPDGTFSRFFGGGKKEVYSRLGRLVKKEDAFRNGLLYEYDRNEARLLSVSDTSGRKIGLTYTSAGLLHKLVDPLNRTLTYDYDTGGNLIRVTGFAGEVISFSYDRDHNLEVITFPDGNKITNVYDTHRDLVTRQEGPGAKRSVYEYILPAKDNPIQQTTVTDANGNKTTYKYLLVADKVRRLIITDAMNGQTIREYDEYGNLTKLTDPNNNSKRYQYDSEGRMLSSTDAEERTWKYTYSQGCNCNSPASATDPLNNTTIFNYNAQFVLSEVVNALGHSTKFKYNSKGDRVEQLTQDGVRTQYQYDPYGNLTAMSTPDSTPTIYKRDLLGQITELVTSGGFRYQYIYNAKGRLTGITNPMGYQIRLSYDPMNRVTAVADDEGQITYHYNDIGKLTSRRDQEGNLIQMEYDALGNLIKKTDAGGNEWRFGYNRLSRLIQVTDPMNQRTRYEYDPVGNLVKITGPLNAQYSLSYNRKNQLTAMADPTGNRISFQYDLLGKKRAVIDAEGHKTEYLYDKTGRLVSSVNALGKVTECVRDKVGNIIKLTDVSGNDIHFQYDKNQRLVKKIDTLNNTTLYRRAPSGWVSEIVKPGGNIVKFEYNPLGFISKILPVNGPPIIFSYNKKGLLIACSEGNNSYRYHYNNVGLLTEAEDIARGKVIRYGYDSRYNRTMIGLSPDGQKINYSYDSLSRMIRQTTGSGSEYLFNYDAAGRRISLIYPNHVKTDYRYDQAGHLMELKTSHPDGKISIMNRYDYNRAGFIIRKTDEHNQVTQYQYDELNRFTQIKYPDNRTEIFTYDPMGNIINKSSSSESVRYNYNKAHQLVSAGDARFDYDLNGNMVKRTINGGTSLYRYDDLSRLREIILPDGQKINYAYSPLGQRVLQTDKKGQTHFIFDGDNPIANLDHNLKIKTWNTFGPGFDEFLAEESEGKMQYYHQNPLGSVIASSDKTGTQTSRVEYEPFGKPVMVSGVLPASSFTGRPYDYDTGLTHFKFRDYDPTIGRFIQQEPLGLWVAWENSYAYASNNPINMIDMYGLLGTWGWVAAIATVAIIAAPLVAAYVVGGTAAYVAGIVVAASAATNALGDMKQDEMRGRDSDTMARNAFIGAATGAASATIGVATGSPVAGAAAGAAFGALDAGLTGNSPGWGAASGAVSGIAGSLAGTGVAQAAGNASAVLGSQETVEAAEALGGAAISGILDYVGAVAQEGVPMMVEHQIENRKRETQSVTETELSTWCP